MRRALYSTRLSVPFAVAFCVVATAGCGSGTSPRAGASDAKGQAGEFFLVTVARPADGTITSGDGRIDCGTSTAICGPVRYEWGETATLTATANAGQMFGTWAGDCQYRGECVLSTTKDGADKYVLAVFGPAREARHGNFTNPAMHSVEFRASLGSPPDTFNCSARSCHGSTLTGSGIAPSCDTCHVAGWRNDCSFCHGAPPPAPHLQVSDCSVCHALTVLPGGAIDVAGGRHMNGTVDLSASGSGGCAGCHAYPPSTGAHVAHFGLSTVPPDAAYSDTRTIQEMYPSTPIDELPRVYAFGCASCHSVDSTKHMNGTRGDIALFEAAAPSTSLKGRATPTASYAAQTCSGIYCHGTADSTPGWTSGSSLGCNGCHGTSTANGAPDYATGSPKANSHPIHPFTCNTCHAPTTSDGTSISTPALHVNGVYDVAPAPGSGVTFTYAYAATGGSCSNISCHSGGSATWGPASSHKATLGAGDVPVYESPGNSDHGDSMAMTEQCSLCHYDNLKTQHANKCDVCHGTGKPGDALIGTWDGTCSSCHPSATTHVGAGADHYGMYWNSSSSCGLCHDGVGGFPGDGDHCDRCHTSPALTAAAVGDHAPPTTTSDALPNYSGTAVINLTATDSGTAGVSTTFVSLNGRAFTPGWTQVTVSRTGVNTLQFYSIDHATNVEAVKTVTFTISAPDTTAPATTSSFNPALGGAYKAQTVTLSASDNVGGSGVKATYYRIDAGAFVQGTSFTISADGLHTFSYYSVDNANNTETTRVSNQFRIDTIAPVTTGTATDGATYTGPQTFTLSPTDSGSGVASSWYKLDGASFTSGTSISVPAPASGSLAHTVQWYSIDAAGNQEVTHTATFTVAAAPDPTPPTTTSSFNPAAGAAFKTQTVNLAATDNVGGSGVKATYYRIDGAAFVQGTTFTLSTEGLHTFSYYSVDNANNTEATHVSNQFRIDNTAPVTTSTATSGATYSGPQTFTLTPTDSGSGVASTWYKLDGASFASGTSVSVPAPASGSVAHTIQWYSIDAAGNQEVTHTATFTVAAGPAGTTTLSFRTNASFGGWSYVAWEVHDSAGNVVNDVNGNPCTWWNDDPAHPSSMWFDYVVPAGVEYTMAGYWGPMPDGPDEDAGTRLVTAAEAQPGATITWWWY